MIRLYKADQWQKHVMGWDNPFPEFESGEREIEIVDEALEALVEANILPHSRYDKDRLLANGDRWEREIAANIARDAPYR